MAITIPDFNTNAQITGQTLINQADEQLNIYMTDGKNYLENISSLIDSYNDAMLVTYQNQINLAINNMQVEVDNKIDELLSVNPDGTYYTKSAIDAKFADETEEIDNKIQTKCLEDFLGFNF
jgi:hypothetical protein